MKDHEELVIEAELILCGGFNFWVTQHIIGDKKKITLVMKDNLVTMSE